MSDTFYGKVSYRDGDGAYETKAYLDNPPLADGSYTGTNKYTDMPVHVRWSDEEQTWVQVCVRDFEYDKPVQLGTFHEVGERPDCICKTEGRP